MLDVEVQRRKVDKVASADDSLEPAGLLRCPLHPRPKIQSGRSIRRWTHDYADSRAFWIATIKSLGASCE